MLTKYENDDYNPLPDMDRMINDVNRNFMSPKIEYFIMDEYTFGNWKRYMLRYREIPMEAVHNAFNYKGIPIAIVQSRNDIVERFVTVVHGYGDIHDTVG